MSDTGTVFEIQRFSIHDGPGIRTTVFMKGCPLRCIWCHNPEGRSSRPQISFIPEKCIGCGLCFGTCTRTAHVMDERGGHVLDRERCEACGACTTECFSGALELVGREMSAEEVLQEVLSDKPFYETSGGGMTLSGGEPLEQIVFAETLLKKATEAGLHCCVETCLHVDYEGIDRVRPYVDTFLCDFKETDPDKHKRFTGVSNDKILSNLHKLHDSGGRICLRCPIIPGCNDREDHFDGIVTLAHELRNIQGVELMPYHPLGKGKLEHLGERDEGPASVAPPSRETVAAWAEKLRAQGVRILNDV